MRRFVILGLLMSGSLAVHAQQSPYAGLETRGIKALSEERVAAFLAGEGMGYAMAAELNGYPGPKHVLELAPQLALSEDQVAAVTAVFDVMHEAALALGSEVVKAEQALDVAFAETAISAETLDELVQAIAALEGRLRLAHLAAHLETKALLTTHQIHQYIALRGYDGMDHSAMQHGKHGQQAVPISYPLPGQPGPEESPGREPI